VTGPPLVQQVAQPGVSFSARNEIVGGAVHFDGSGCPRATRRNAIVHRGFLRRLDSWGRNLAATQRLASNSFPPAPIASRVDQTVRLDGALAALRARPRLRPYDTDGFFAEGDRLADEPTTALPARSPVDPRRATTRLVLLRQRIRTLRGLAVAVIASLATVAGLAAYRDLGRGPEAPSPATIQTIQTPAEPAPMTAPVSPSALGPLPPPGTSVGIGPTASPSNPSTDRAAHPRPTGKPRARIRPPSSKAAAPETADFGVPGEREF
jgi:hypothetical protein